MTPKPLSPIPPRDWPTFAAIVLLAFLLRLIHLFQAQSVVFFYALVSDGQAYDEWAQRIAAGDWLGSGVFYQAPLYPYFLAVLQKFVGHDLWWIRVIQVALGSLSCGFLFLAGRRFFSRPIGIAAGILLAIYPHAIFFDALIQKAVLDLFSACLLLYLLAGIARNHTSNTGTGSVSMGATVRPAEKTLRRLGNVQPGLTVPAREGPSQIDQRPYARWLAVGAVLALLALTRENAVLLILPIAAWLWLHFNGRPRTTRARWLLSLAAGFALILLPVGLRNLIVGGEFALTTSQAGPNFYIGNNPQAPGVYVPLLPGRSSPSFERRDATELAEKATGRTLTPREVSHYWLGQSFKFILEQPGAWLKLFWHKCLLTINWYEVPDAEDFYFYERSCGLLRILASVLHFGVLVPIAAAGIVLSWPKRREIWLLHAMLFTIFAAVALFYVFARYRYPMVPFLILFAAAALVSVFDSIRQRRSAGATALSPPSGATASSSGAPNKSPATRETRRTGATASSSGAQNENPATRETRRSGATASSNGTSNKGPTTIEERRRGATASSSAASDKSPPHHNRHWIPLGIAAFVATLAAIAANQTFFNKESQLTVSYANAGYAMMVQNKPELAVEYLRKAIQANPRFMGGHFHLGRALLKSGRIDEAIDSLSTALSREPDAPRVHVQLGIALGIKGDTRRAIEFLERGLQGDPKDAEALKFLGMILFEQKQWPRAIDLLRRAVAQTPDDPAACLMLASALSTTPQPDLRDPPAAITLAETALKKLARPNSPSDTGDANALDVLAAAYASAGQFDQAISTARRALQAATAAASGIGQPSASASGPGPTAAPSAGSPETIAAHLKLYESAQPFFRDP